MPVHTLTCCWPPTHSHSPRLCALFAGSRFCTLDDIACSNDGHVAGVMGDHCFCVCHEGFTGSHCEIGNSLRDCEGTPGGGAVIDACGVCGGDSSACAGLCTLPTSEAAASQFVPLQLQQCIEQSRCTYRNGACEERYPCSGTSKKKCGARVDCEWDFIGPNSCTTRLQASNVHPACFVYKLMSCDILIFLIMYS